jgi:hypothetical protein
MMGNHHTLQKMIKSSICMPAEQGAWNVCLETQPTKSPDTNVLDLSFFRALQAKQRSLGSETTIDGLVAHVLRTFIEFDPRKIDCGFLTLQTCLKDMLEVNCGNEYNIQHLGKQAILREEFGHLKLAILGMMIRMLAPATAPMIK